MKIGLIIAQIIAKFRHLNFGDVEVAHIVVLPLDYVCVTVVKFSVLMGKRSHLPRLQ